VSIQHRKRGPKKRDPDSRLEAAIQNGLSKDKSGISNNLVHKKLGENSKLQYDAMMETWRGYVSIIFFIKLLSFLKA
jgi:hypothetical protein